MYAKIINNLVAERTDDLPELAPGECALIVEVGPEVQVGWLWTPQACVPPPVPVVNPNAAIFAQIAALEALQTSRLVRESLLKKQTTITDAASPLNGLTPAEAIAYIDAQIEELRAQLVSP